MAPLCPIIIWTKHIRLLFVHYVFMLALAIVFFLNFPLACIMLASYNDLLTVLSDITSNLFEDFQPSPRSSATCFHFLLRQHPCSPLLSISVLVIYCITKHPKMSWLKVIHYFCLLHVSLSSLGCGEFCPLAVLVTEWLESFKSSGGLTFDMIRLPAGSWCWLLWPLNWGCWMVCLDKLEFLIIWSLGSELELPKSKCSKRQDMHTASPAKGYACNLHSVTSTEYCWSKQTQNPQWRASSHGGLLQHHFAENLVGWGKLLWPTWKIEYVSESLLSDFIHEKIETEKFSLSPLLKGIAQAIIFYVSLLCFFCS